MKKSNTAKILDREKLKVAKSSVTKPPFADFIAILHPNLMDKKILTNMIMLFWKIQS